MKQIVRKKLKYGEKIMMSISNTERGTKITFYMRIRQKCSQRGEKTKNKKLVTYWSHLYNDL